MAEVKGLYDADVIAKIIGKGTTSETSAPAEPVEDPFTQIKEFKVKKETGYKKFSELFWPPTTIPDLPIRVYKEDDWHEEAQFHIPSVDPHWVWDKAATEKLALALYCKDTTLLHGLQGTGKSCLAEQWCAKFIIPFWRMNCNRETREGHFLGSPGVEYNELGQMFIKQEPTALTDSLKYGGLFCEDEAFRHNAGLVLQSLREKNSRFVLLPDAPGRTSSERKLVAPKDTWWYVLTDNTCGLGDETGTFDAEVQDVSSLDRIGATIEVEYLKPSEEVRILSNHSKLNDDIINGMVSFGNLVRTAFRQQTLLTTISVRGLMSWAEKTEIVGDIALALRISWFDKLSRDDQAACMDMFHQVFARKLTG